MFTQHPEGLASSRNPKGSSATLLVLEIDGTRDYSRRARAVSSLLAPLARPEAAARKLRTAVAELLENAARYSNGGTVRLSVCIDPDSGDFRVQTENCADPEHAERLAARLDLLSARGPREAYRGLLVDSTERGLPVGLGLARLAGEAGVRLATRIVDDRIQVVAASRVPSFLPAMVVDGSERGGPQVYLAQPSLEATETVEDWGGYVRLLAEAMLPGSELDPIDSRVWERLQVEEFDRGVRVRGSWARGEA